MPDRKGQLWEMLCFDVEDLMAAMPVLAGVSRTMAANQKERMRVIISILMHHLARTGTPDDYMNLHFDRLATVIRAGYLAALKEALVRARIIECDGLCVLGEKSFGYRLHGDILSRPVKAYPLSRSMQKHLFRQWPELSWGIEHGVPTDPNHLIIWRHLSRLSSDTRAWTFVAGKDYSQPERQQRLATLNMLGMGVRALKVGPNSGRLFSLFTGFASDLRPFLRLDGNVCAEVDICASQPYFASRLLPSDSPERDAYLGLVTSGKFYEGLAEAAGETFATRKKLKEAVQVEVFFGGRKYRRRLWDAFARLYPELAGRIDALADASEFAVMLQHAEAEVVIGRVVPILERALEGRPFLTLHDSLFCTTTDAIKVAEVLRAECLRACGAEPGISITDHSISSKNTFRPGERIEYW